MINDLTYFQQKVALLFEQAQFVAEPEGLYAPIDYTLRLGGKRLRPTLLLVANAMFGGDEEAASPAAIGIEMFHNFTLLHDDLMDQSPLRRGQPTVYRKWNANTAILSGDTMFALAWRYFLQHTTSRQTDILQCFCQTGIEVCEGQQYDMEFEQRMDVSIEQYMMMITKKTAVLLAGALRIGALYANAPQADIEALYNYGLHLGIAFQLEDDLLDAYGNTAEFGKPTGQDIRDRKKTYLPLRAMQLASTHTREKIIDLYTSTTLTNDVRVAETMAIFDQLDIRNHTLAAIDTQYKMATECLDQINLPEDNKAPLRQMLNQLKGRKK